MFKTEEALENVCKEVIIKEFDAEAVSKMIEYIYTDELKQVYSKTGFFFLVFIEQFIFF
jgi:hypothetical protein